MASISVSVVIPTLNESINIERAIRSSFAAGAREVIVSDGGSVDATRTIAEQAGATVLLGPAGRAAQQNAGARHARFEFLLFLHADNWLSRNVVDQIMHCADQGGIAGGFRQAIDATGWRFRLLEMGNAAQH